jgi:pimeloyl-ACP methyl ester carboxylesterase
LIKPIIVPAEAPPVRFGRCIQLMAHGMNDPDVPIILLPGLNGDARIFGPQAAAFPSLRSARWLEPGKSESLAAYAERMARTLDPGRPCLIGGVSFGGVVALEMARHLQVRVCVLIASSRDVDGLPAAVRILRPIAAVVPPIALTLGIRCGAASAASAAPRFHRRIARLSPAEFAFRRWALQALLTWRVRDVPECPVVQIHGQHDATFAASRTKADVILPHAGHLLSLTHAEQVSSFIRSAIGRFAA